ncbi:MAG TPA: SDR family NAD(P)-dependent oxidoreductase [Terracidiphilus sp.]|nr:SDR family NAD(P)-dependent oxidoreductase [Terracidiphilus sp.]
MSHADGQRTALITGASRGLGSAIALEQAAAGANVAVNYFKNGEAASALCQRIEQNGGRAQAFRADVRDEGEVAGLVREIESAFGGVDILVVNATGHQPFLSIEEQTWQSYLEVVA